MGTSLSNIRGVSMAEADKELMMFPFGELPEELAIHILTFLPHEDLLRLRLVSAQWKQLIDTKSLWLTKCHRDNVTLPPTSVDERVVPLDYKKIYVLKPFNRNLLKNWDAECTRFSLLDKVIERCTKDEYSLFGSRLRSNRDSNAGFACWRILAQGGDQFKIESEVPHYAHSLAEVTDCDVKKCWATSFAWCSKEQWVDLWSMGVSSMMLDRLQPLIVVSDWIASRHDCASKYRMGVRLLTTNKNTVVDQFEIAKSEDQWGGGAWTKVEHTFKNYGSGVRYVHFRHDGKDGQFWSGHYGVKMAAPCVKVVFAEN